MSPILKRDIGEQIRHARKLAGAVTGRSFRDQHDQSFDKRRNVDHEYEGYEADRYPHSDGDIYSHHNRHGGSKGSSSGQQYVWEVGGRAGGIDGLEAGHEHGHQGSSSARKGIGVGVEEDLPGIRRSWEGRTVVDDRNGFRQADHGKGKGKGKERDEGYVMEMTDLQSHEEEASEMFLPPVEGDGNGRYALGSSREARNQGWIRRELAVWTSSRVADLRMLLLEVGAVSIPICTIRHI